MKSTVDKIMKKLYIYGLMLLSPFVDAMETFICIYRER